MGTYRALRNIPVGWTIQAIHATDRSERYFRIFCEGAVLAVLVSFLRIADILSLLPVLVLFLVIHTFFWFLTGNFWVYMLDSFGWMRNPGLPAVLAFIGGVNTIFRKTASVDYILIYGSMCRGQFHRRSDLDLRVIRRKDIIGLIALPVGFLMRIYAFCLVMPVDLQVVDSVHFLKKQMREDEKPIVVFKRGDMQSFQGGMDFGEIVKDPRIVLKNDRLGVA